MATWEDVRRACLALPETTEQVRSDGTRSWRVRDKALAWERPLRTKDLAELGDAAPTGPVLAARVPDEGAKTALIVESPRSTSRRRTSPVIPRCSAGWTNSTTGR